MTKQKIIFILRCILALPLAAFIGYAAVITFMGGEKLLCVLASGIPFYCFNPYFDYIARVILFSSCFMASIYHIIPTHKHFIILTLGIILSSLYIGFSAFYYTESKDLLHHYSISSFIGGVYTLIMAYQTYKHRFRDMW